MEQPFGPASSSTDQNMDHNTPWPRNLYFHIKRREWRARYIYQGKKRMKNFSLKRYSCETSLILGAHFLREMKKRRIPSDSEIANWNSELRAVLPQYQCNAFEPKSKNRKTTDSSFNSQNKSKSIARDGDSSGNSSNKGFGPEVIMHYHAPVVLPGKNDNGITSISNISANQAAFVTATANAKSFTSKILEKIPSKFNDAIHDINRLICIASQSIPYIPLGGVFNPDPRCPLRLMSRKRPKATSGSEPDDFEGLLFKNECFQDHLSPSNLQDDYFNVCHTLNQLSQECSNDMRETPEFKESDFYTYRVINEKVSKTLLVGKMPSISHRLKCATNTILALSKWHNSKIMLDKNIHKHFSSESEKLSTPSLSPLDNSINNIGVNQNGIGPGITKIKKTKKRDDWPEACQVKFISISEYCNLVSDVIRQVESNLETISQMSKCPALMDDPKMYIKQSLNSAIPNFPSIFNVTCRLEKNLKLNLDHEPHQTKLIGSVPSENKHLNDSKDAIKNEEHFNNFRMPISLSYRVNNSLYDNVNSSRYLPKAPTVLKESPIAADSDTNYATRLLKPLSEDVSNGKMTNPSNFNFLCSSGLLALINQAQCTRDPEELASIILSAMMVNQPDEPVLVDNDTNAKCQKVAYVNGIVVLHDDNASNQPTNVDNNQLLVKHQAQAIAKLKRALSFGTVGSKMTIRGQIGIKISTLLNDVLKVSQHKTKLLAILNKLRHLDKRSMEMVVESEKLHKALHYYYKAITKPCASGVNDELDNKDDSTAQSQDKEVDVNAVEFPPNYIEELLNLETLHVVCETIMETKVKLTEQMINFFEHQCAIMDKIIPETLCKAIEIILYGRDKKVH